MKTKKQDPNPHGPPGRRFSRIRAKQDRYIAAGLASTTTEGEKT